MELSQRLRRGLIEPSPQITEPDQRRLAALLSTFLLGTILLGSLAETLTVLLIRWEHYTGYRTTVIGVILLTAIYGISRTERVHLAAVLSVIVASLGIFLAGWTEPAGVQGGLFDYLILPLWLGSLYLSVRALIVLTCLDALTLLAFPLLLPDIHLNDVLIGPFSFLIVTSTLLMVITRHRNLLEHDRRAELTEKELRSRMEAARSAALLRVAERLNAQLDLDTLLNAICEETTLALNTPVALVVLYDPRLDLFQPAAAVGIPGEVLQKVAPFDLHGHKMREMGRLQRMEDLYQRGMIRGLTALQPLDLRSLAFATIEYEGEVIGSLIAMTQGEERDFSEEELLLLQGLARQSALAIINTRLFKEARRRLERLQALRAIDMAIVANRDLRDTLDVLLQQITSQLAVDAAVILLMDEQRQQLEYGASIGLHSPSLRFTRLRIGEGIAGRAARQSKIVHIHDLQTDPETLAYSPSLAREGFVSYFAAPLVAQGSVKGVLEVFHRSVLNPNSEWLGFLEALAGQAAIAIENTTLFEDLQRTNAELSNAYDATIEGWSHALDLRDKETEGHTQRVSELTVELARAFGFSDPELVQIRRGALLHDIGKMGVPDSILLKEGALSAQEWDVMRKHPGFAHEMLQPIHYLRMALDIPYCHHERWDGRGYPRGLQGEEIPLTARIFSVVDVWDALTSDRPYRAAWSSEQTLAYIRENAGSHFDPQVVQVFVELVEQRMRSLAHAAAPSN